MAPTDRRPWLWDVLWLLAWGIASSAWCVSAAGKLGATFDEPVYMAKGLDFWRTGSHRGLIRLGTMPLPVDVETLPVYAWEWWRGQPFDAAADLEQILPVARAGTLFFWWLLLIYAGRLGRAVGGPWGGRLAIALLACEPSFLAHAGLATTDIAVSASLLALLYHFRAGRDAGWWSRVAVPAVWFGAAVLAKASGMVFGAICLTAIEFERLYREGLLAWPAQGGVWGYLRHCWKQTRPARRDLLQVGLLGMAITFAYVGSDWQPEPSFVAWAHGLPEGASKQTMTWLADHLRVFANAGEGIVRQVKHNLHGHGAYLLGRSDPRSFWYYFPVLLTIKLSVPLLVTPLLVLLVRARALVNWVCVAAVALLLFSFTWRVQIGVRLVLPVVAVATAGVAAALARAWQESNTTWRRRLLAGGAALGLAWTAAAAAAVWPHGLCYVNELYGGTATGYLQVSDANYDWGQGVPELARWERDHHLDTMDVWYFGTDPAMERLPMRQLRFHQLPIRQPDDVLSLVRGHYLAVGTTVLFGEVSNEPAHRQAATFLRGRQPVARTTTFLIYDFTREGPALSQAAPPVKKGG